jgi:Sortase domain
VNEIPATVRRVTWMLVTVLLLASAGSAAVAAGIIDVAALPGLGPYLAGSKDAPRAAALRPAPVVAPSRSAGPAVPSGAAAAAPVLPAYEVGTSSFRPARLVLPGGRSAVVSAVGLHRDGSLVVPDNPRVVGWWTGGSRAGDPFGSIVVAGHVDSATRGVGVLAALPALRAGQVVALTAGRRTARYVVVSGGLVRQSQLSRTSGLFRTNGSAQLVLITCGGPFDPVTHHYADNYVVVARPAS